MVQNDINIRRKNLIEIVKNDLKIWQTILGVDLQTAKKMYQKHLADQYNLLQTQRDKYKNVLRKVVKKMNKIKEIGV